MSAEFEQNQQPREAYSSRTRLMIDFDFKNSRAAIPPRLRLGSPGPSVTGDNPRRSSPSVPYLEWTDTVDFAELVEDDEDTILPWHEGAPLDGCLLAFTRLSAQPEQAPDPGQYIQFARQFGVLGICAADGAANSESARGSPGTYLGKLPPSITYPHEGTGTPWYWERLADWQAWVREFQALIRIMRSLWAERPTKLEDWKVVLVPEIAYLSDRAARHGADVSSTSVVFHSSMKDVWGDRPQLWLNQVDQHKLLADHIQYLTRLANLGFRVSWGRSNAASGPLLRPVAAGEWSFQPNPFREIDWPENMLFSVLVAQLLEVFLGATDDFRDCTICGHAYLPSRRPAPGRGHYCSEECRELARLRDKRASYHKNKARWPSVIERSSLGGSRPRPQKP